LAVSFVRPELVERLRPWREALLWGAVLAVGVLFVMRGIQSGGVLLVAFGLVLSVAGGGLVVTERRRRRMQGQAPDEGVVTIEEARIGYFGPRSGGFLDLDALERVEILTDGQRPTWRLVGQGEDALRIPIGARGAEGIYDALAAFASLDEEALHAALATRRPGRFPVWVRAEEPPRLRLP
jgi:hypothetical protein